MVLPSLLVQVPAKGRLIKMDHGVRQWRAYSEDGGSGAVALEKKRAVGVAVRLLGSFAGAI